MIPNNHTTGFRLIFLLFTVVVCNYQNTFGNERPVTPKAYSIKPHYGFVILHSQDVAPIGKSYPYGLGIEIFNHYNSEKSFDNCLCFPRLGVSTVFWNFDNPEILGYGVTSVFFVEPFFGANRRFSYSFRAGIGPAYATNPFDEIQNPDNLSYSTRISFALMVASTINLKISDRFFLNLSANYNHISNGGMREPNKGINYPTLSFGLDYYPISPEFPDFAKKDWRAELKNKTKFHAFLFGTAKQVSRADGLKRYPVIGLDVRVSRRVSRLNALNLGAAFFDDRAHREEMKRAGIVGIDYKKAGLLAGNEFLLGRFIFSQQFGVYIYNPYKRDADVFQRYGLNISFAKRMIAGVGLNAHGHVADFLELRFGVSF
jgi:hypothetical protein